MTHDIVQITARHERIVPDMIAMQLNEYGIPYKSWGTKGSKSFDELLGELEVGESRLEVRDGQLVRCVDGVGVDVFAEVGGRRYRLVEDRQEYRVDGAVRRRHPSTSIGEKCGRGMTRRWSWCVRYKRNYALLSTRLSFR